MIDERIKKVLHQRVASYFIKADKPIKVLGTH